MYILLLIAITTMAVAALGLTSLKISPVDVLKSGCAKLKSFVKR